MISKFRFILIIIYLLMSIVDIGYGNDVKIMQDLLNDDISLSDKLEYLNLIKDNDNYSFSTEDIDLITYTYLENQYAENISKRNQMNRIISEIKHGIEKESKEINPNPEDKKIMDKIRATILEILLKDNIDNGVLTPEQITAIAYPVILDLYSSFDLPSEIRYLSLKVLIKINELKLNADDEHSIFMREVRNQALADNSELMKEMEEQEKSHAKKGFWDWRGIVEGCIFSPVLLLDYGFYNRDTDDKHNYYKTEDKEILKNYEKYLLDRIKFFPITDSLKVFVESAFFNTQFKQFRTLYIDAMFALDMKETLMRIIISRHIDIDLRKQAIEVAIKLFDQLDTRQFKIFSTLLQQSLGTIILGINKEVEELRIFAREKSEYIYSVESKHDDMKDLKYVVLNSNISVDEKIEYLNNFVKLGWSLKAEDLGSFIHEVLNTEDLDIKVKARVASIFLYRINMLKDISEILKDHDVEAMVFLYVMEEGNRGPELEGKSLDKTLEFMNFIKSSITEKVIIEQSGRFDMWKNLIKFIDGTVKKANDSLKRLAIRTSLDLLGRTKDFEEFSYAFIESLQKISSSTEESHDLKNIADYILVKIKRKELSLKDASNDCALTMML